MFQFEIPWHQPEQWQELHDTLSYLHGHFRNHLAEAEVCARSIETRLTAVFPVMDELCAGTCPECREPCCTVATLWYNFQDILFLHLAGQDIPPGQPMTGLHQGCRYLTPQGCRLPRMARPWICTWYVCPPQTSLLRKNGRSARKKWEDTVSAVRDERRAMEDAFIRGVSGERL